MNSQAISYGKIILVGEHSVVYNKAAIAIPFAGAKISVSISQADNLVFNSSLYKGNFDLMPEFLEGIKTAILRFLSDYKLEDSNFAINVESSIPYERGMGSSAAISKASISALYNYFTIDYTNEDLLNYVNISEEIYHGNPSGIDSNIIVYNRPIYYIKNKTLEFFDYDLDAYLIVADTNIKGNTKVAVSKVKSYLDLDKNNFKLIDALDDLANNAYSALIDNDKIKLGSIMNEAQTILKTLTISNDTIDHLVATALKNGALGAKLTGGGLGGCIICLCSDLDSANYVSNKLLESGAKNTWITSMAKGVDNNES